MAEALPAGIPTLTSVEATWTGPVAEGVPKGTDRSLRVHTIADKDINALLKAQMVIPYALCDDKGHLVCFYGFDKGGNDVRVYDILAFHKPGRPDDSIYEQYDGDYVETIILRQASKAKYVRCSADDDLEMRHIQERRASKSALAWAQEEVTTYLNRYFGVVADTQSSVAMKRVSTLAEPPKIAHMTNLAFVRTYGNHKLIGDKLKMSSMWLEHSKRRGYDGIGFAETVPPNYLNYWTGLKPIAEGTDSEDARPFFDYVYEILCRREDSVFVYLVNFLAHCMRYPLVKKQVCVGMKGDQGSGKSVLVDGVFRPIFRQYCTTVTMEELRKFNGCLKHTLIAFLDEAVPQDDKVAIAKYKSMVTSPTMRFEEKFMSSYELPNYINPIVATNWDMGGILEHDDRRLLCLGVSNERADVSIPANVEYWNRLWGSLNPDAIHQALLEIPLNGFSLRAVPMTAAKREQKRMGLKSPIIWYVQLVEEGSSVLLEDMTVSKEEVYGEYLRWHERNYPGRKPEYANRFWPMLKELLGEVYEEPSRSADEGTRKFVIPARTRGKDAVCRYMRDPAFFA
jgi:hypothetical protein